MIPRQMWFGLILWGAALQIASAQQGMGAQQSSLGQNQTIAAAIVQPVAGQPYQAEKVTHSKQILGDGTVISHDTRGLIARDSQGRMREEVYMLRSGNVNGKQMDMNLQSATVGDPIAHTMLLWIGDTKIAMQMKLPSLPSLPVSGGVMGALGTPPPVVVRRSGDSVQMIKEDAPPPTSTRNINMPNVAQIAGANLASKNNVRTEDLGKQSIEGVLVTGKRTTTTIPAGEIGNDRPIVVVHEEWRSPELKIIVKTIDTDPRTGEQTMELQGLSRADPDPSLFQAPAGYKVQDMSDMLKDLGNLGRPKTP